MKRFLIFFVCLSVSMFVGFSQNIDRQDKVAIRGNGVMSDLA